MITRQSLGPNFEHVSDIHDAYVQGLTDAESQLELKHKTLKQANIEQASHRHFYDERKVELAAYLRVMESEIENIRGRLTKKYNEHYNRVLTERTRDKYIDNEESIINATQIYNSFKELHDKYTSVVDCFTTRGYALNNLTEIAVNQLNDYSL